MAKLLLDEIWQYIGFKLPVADRIRFRAVCKTWMSLLPSRQPPWLLLAESEDDEDEEAAQLGVGPIVPNRAPPNRALAFARVVPQPNPVPPRRGFVSLGEELPYRIHLPEIHRARCLGSTGNCLITAHKDKSIRLLNPFSGCQIPLPSQLEFDKGVDYHGSYELARVLLWKVILSSPPSDRGDSIAMAIHGGEKILAIARLGDEKWTTVEISDPPAPYKVDVGVADDLSIGLIVGVEVDDAVFYKGHFYAVTNRGELLVCDVGVNPPKATYLSGPIEEFSVFRIKYLVEWLGELLMAVKCVDMIDNGLRYRTSRFEIYKFDFIGKNWNVLNSLGEHSLFLGFNTSVSSRASDYYGLVKRNCVYFTDDFLFGYRNIGHLLDTEGGHDMGIFDLEDDMITPHFTGVSTSHYSPPVWIVPT